MSSFRVMDEREPRPGEAEVYGLLAAFPSASILVKSIRSMQTAGYRSMDAFSPFPIDDVEKALDSEERGVPYSAIAGGLIGLATGFFIQIGANLDYPLNVGGRPLLPLHIFALVSIQLALLFAIVGAVLAVIVQSRLPRLNHPLFGADVFRLDNPRGFYLLLLSNDEKFNVEEAGALLKATGANAIREVGFSEAPE